MVSSEQEQVILLGVGLTLGGLLKAAASPPAKNANFLALLSMVLLYLGG